MIYQDDSKFEIERLKTEIGVLKSDNKALCVLLIEKANENETLKNRITELVAQCDEVYIKWQAERKAAVIEQMESKMMDPAVEVIVDDINTDKLTENSTRATSVHPGKSQSDAEEEMADPTESEKMASGMAGSFIAIEALQQGWSKQEIENFFMAFNAINGREIGSTIPTDRISVKVDENGFAHGIKVKDDINHPEHYQSDNGIECIDAIQAALTPEEFRGHCKGNIMKYTWRERNKQGDDSLRKARWYINKLLVDE